MYVDARGIYGRQLYGKRRRETIDLGQYSGCVHGNNKVVVSGEVGTSPRRKVAIAVLKNDPL